MLLTIDVGNTEMKLGVYGKERKGQAQLIRVWRLTTERRRTADEYGIQFVDLFAFAGLDPHGVTAVAIASVVPACERSLRMACEAYFGVEPTFLRSAAQTLIPIRTQQPRELGADIVAGAIGGVEKYGAPLIVVGYGTATTYAAISAEGEILGTAIAPGIQISFDALVGRTAQLPQVSLESINSVIGRNTQEALQSGVIYGVIGQTEGIVARMRAELGLETRVVATGGLADLVARHQDIFDAIDAVDPHLNLEGLRLFARTLERVPADAT
ncbi:MAG TPA: type III pantothenate kinase [Candidatus Dormibacteraeota bacterium]|nr:type III pantothenate kinase [Candidatus Dormibacteraeota bacterium]